MKQLNLQKQQNRLRNKFINMGVKMLGPETIYFSKDTKIGKNVVIEPYVVFGSKVKVGNNVTIKSFSHLENCKIENKVDVGPYARIRPGVTLKEGSKIGNFVEIKKSKTKIKDNVFIGSNSSLVAPLTIEDKSVVGAGSVVTKKVRKKSLVLTRAPQIEVKNYKRKIK